MKFRWLNIMYPFGQIVIAFIMLAFTHRSNASSGLFTKRANIMKDTTMMQTVTSKDGTTIVVWKRGKGPPLLLIHGTSADHHRWSGILPELEPYFTVYTMDRRGRGGSTDGPEYSIFREAEDVAAVVEHIGEPLYVLGHSYGAVCALEGALLTEKISRLVLYEPPIPTGVPMYPNELPDRMQALIDQDSLEPALELFMREVVRMPTHELKAYRQLPMWSLRIQITPTIPRELAVDRSYQFDSKRFEQFQIPTLLLLGGDSPDLFSRAIEVLNSTLESSTVLVLPGQQHIAMDTNPDLFVREVLRFLQE